MWPEEMVEHGWKSPRWVFLRIMKLRSGRLVACFLFDCWPSCHSTYMSIMSQLVVIALFITILNRCKDSFISSLLTNFDLVIVVSPKL